MKLTVMELGRGFFELVNVADVENEVIKVPLETKVIGWQG